MKPRIVFASMLAITALAAQSNTTKTDTPKASISGIVQQIGSSAPITGAELFVNLGQKSAQTDAAGRYEIKDLPPGVYTMRVYSNRGRGPRGTKIVSLNAGQDLTVDFHLKPMASISGRIVDENNEPFAEAEVFLIAREYRLGGLRYVYAGAAQTDDRGQYVLPNVEPGRGFLIKARNRLRRLDAISPAPADVKLRKRAIVPTWYPDSESFDAAQVLVLQPGEHREAVDIRMMRSASHCFDGVLSTGNGPAPLNFEIQEREPTSGESGDRAMFVSAPWGKAGPDGRIRVCDLHPGVYRLTAYQAPETESQPGPLLLGETEIEIGDKDLHNLRIVGNPRVPVTGEIAWYGNAPDQPVTEKMDIWLQPMARAPFRQELQAFNIRSSVPGRFTIAGLLPDDYSLRVMHLPDGAYIKDIIYGGLSALHEPIRVGKTMGSDLRLILAHDGAVVSVRVTDKDSNPVPDCNVVLLPADASTDAALADAMLVGQTDQYGRYASGQLAPGKYFALATNASVDRTPETIANLSRARLHAQKLDLAPNAKVQITVSPIDIE